ncbi:MAG: hypothetical protein ACK559_29230 [bacterium]
MAIAAYSQRQWQLQPNKQQWWLQPNQGQWRLQPNLVLEGDHGAAEVYVGLHVKVFKSKKEKRNLAMYLFCRKMEL